MINKTNAVRSIIASAVLVILCGCFRRPEPDKSSFIKQCIPEITNCVSSDVNYIYHGGVGGFVALAKIEGECAEDISIFNNLGISLVLKEGDPAYKDGVEYAMRLIHNASAGDEVPTWVNLNYNDSIVIYTSSVSSAITRNIIAPSAQSNVLYVIVYGE